MTDIDFPTIDNAARPQPTMLDYLADPAIRVVAWPGRRVAVPLLAGDVVIRQSLGGARRSFILTAPVNRGGRAEARALDVDALASGRPAGVSLPLFGPDRLLRGDLTVIRPISEAEETALAGETLPPPPVTRPTIRSGSRGPAVMDAQQRLNIVHQNRLAEGQGGLADCPLAVDSIFGPHTRAATLSFQRIAFPTQPSEWDGIIGPHTWRELIARSERRPPGPVIPSITQLNPSRWDAILRPFATGRTNLRTGNAVAALIDGNATFNTMAADMGATSGERDFIYLLGWDNFDTFPLGAASTFREIYTAAAGRGVEVAAMLWDQFGIVTAADRSATEVVRHINALRAGKAIKDDLTTNHTTASTVRLAIAAALAGSNPRLIPVILRIIEPDIARLTGSHHQKVLIVKRGEVLVSYCGGIDMNPNRVRVVDADTGQPHHDTHCRIVGPSAHDLLSTFIARWQHHPDSSRFGALRGIGMSVPAAITSPSAIDAPFGGPLSVMIARTFNPVRPLPPTVVAERAIKPVLLAAISNAKRFIYCEDQYLIDLDTARALIAAVPRLRHVTILIPGNPITDVPFGKEYRRDFGALIDAGLSSADRAKLGIFQLTTSQSAPTFGDHTYVHSKSWVFDDELAVIGTANCNRRSYTFDSEVDAFIFEDQRGENDARQTFAQRYRMALWQHHLAVPGRSVADGVASAALWRAAGRPASARVIEFDHRLPTGVTSIAGLRQAVMDRGAAKLHDVIDPFV
jgi:phosphatidylserine/phosphatidylglycerophosphate/cardiolipin synthase-like enzyme